MKSDARPSQSSYEEAIQSTETPDWCGQELSTFWKHYIGLDLEPNQSAMENLSGPYWLFFEDYEGGDLILILLNADGTSEEGYSYLSEEECEEYEEYGLYWSEEYEICIGEGLTIRDLQQVRIDDPVVMPPRPTAQAHTNTGRARLGSQTSKVPFVLSTWPRHAR